MSARTVSRLILAGVAILMTLPALADFRLERKLDLAPGGRLVVDSDLGRVTVTGSRDSGVHVLITSTRSDIEDDVAFDFFEEDGTVRVEARKERRGGLFSWLRGSRDGSLHFEIEVPGETEVLVETGGGSVRVSRVRGDVDLETSGGSVKVYDVGGDVLAHTSGGSIVLERLSGKARVSTSGGSITGESIGGSLEAKTSGGSISLEGIGGDLYARTSGGPIRIEEAGGRVEASTSGGSIVASYAEGNLSGGSFSSSGGGIRVSIDRAANLDVDAHTSGGSVQCDLPITVRGKISRGTLRGTVGSGGETLRIRTSGGSIRILER
jgi:DUF4097 and DUF4098 domain-containing protein YvlB